MICWRLSCKCDCELQHQQCRVAHSDLPNKKETRSGMPDDQKNTIEIGGAIYEVTNELKDALNNLKKI